jgi:protein-disulfide isomerase
MRLALVALAPLVAAALSSPASAKEPLFQYKGKTYQATDLSPSAQQALYDLEADTAARYEAFADQAILDVYFDDLAKSTGKPRKDVEDNAFKAAEPTDKDVNDWYEANKGRLPPGYKLEQIKGDVKTLLKGEQKKKQREALLAKLKKDGTAKYLGAEPVAPVVKIDTLGYPVKGSKDAKLTIVEFADYQCPHCKAAVDDIEKILKKYDGKVNLVFMDFPINPSGISTLVADGAFCAEKQGKYWEYHDLAYANQRTLDKDSPAKLAKELKLDEKAFGDCFATSAPKDRVAKARSEGDRVGVGGTPTLFLNGKRVKSHEEAELEKAIDSALKGGV